MPVAVDFASVSVQLIALVLSALLQHSLSKVVVRARVSLYISICHGEPEPICQCLAVFSCGQPLDFGNVLLLMQCCMQCCIPFRSRLHVSY